MSKQLGTRCPECGEKPQITIVDYEKKARAYKWVYVVVCPGCGRGASGSEALKYALASFYGPQAEGPLPLPPLVPTLEEFKGLDGSRVYFYSVTIQRADFNETRVEGPIAYAPEAALEAWNKMVREASHE